MKEVSPPPLYHTYYSKSSPSMFAKASLPSSVLASNTAKAVFACPLSSIGLFVVSDEVQPLTRSANTSGLRSRSISRSLSLNTFIFPASVFGTTSIFSPSVSTARIGMQASRIHGQVVSPTFSRCISARAALGSP